MAIIERKLSYGVRVHVADGKYEWVGSFPFAEYGGKRAAKEAAVDAEREAKKQRFRPRSLETCASFAQRWTQDYSLVKRGPTRGRQKSAKTIAVYRSALKQFTREFGSEPLSHVDRQQARRFASSHSAKVSEVVRAMFADALEDGLITANPFFGLQLPESSGRRHHAPITEAELRALADFAIEVHGEKYGPVYRAFILFSGYVGCRLEEGFNIEYRDVRIAEQEVDLRVTKFDKPRTVLLRREAIEAFQSIPRRVDQPEVFYGKSGQKLTKGNHQSLWTPIRAAWWATLPEERKQQIVKFVWHSLRHFNGHWFYIGLGLGSELAAFQLGHADPSLIERLYGHPFDGALERLKRAANAPKVVPIQDANQMQAKENSA